MLLHLFAIVVLVLLNGFFVGAEFALVRSRRARLEAMTRQGDWKARVALRATSRIGALLPACQLGVTLASVGLGWVAQSTLASVFEALVEQLPLAVTVPLRVTLASVFAIVSVTYLHVVFGELAPRAAALDRPERLARWLAPPLMAFAWLTTPFTWALNRSSQVVLRVAGQRAASGEDAVHSPEELRLLVEQSQEGGALEKEDAALIEGVFEFSEKNAREVMTPRTEIVALPADATLQETLQIVDDGGFSRYPVFDETIDNIVGLVLAKDLLTVLRHEPATFSVDSVMRAVHVVPGTREVEEVLADFKRVKAHLAVVLDEYGGTAGIVTMEDLLEEIVGEIQDEYDEPEETHLARGPDEVVMPGGTHIGELNDRLGLAVPDEDFTTVGGFVFGSLGRLPVVGDRVTAGGAHFTVREMAGRRIESLSVDLHGAGDRRAADRAPRQNQGAPSSDDGGPAAP